MELDRIYQVQKQDTIGYNKVIMERYTKKKQDVIQYLKGITKIIGCNTVMERYTKKEQDVIQYWNSISRQNRMQYSNGTVNQNRTGMQYSIGMLYKDRIGYNTVMELYTKI